MQDLLSALNPEQRLAAETSEGPLLLLAGAGTGKTRAISFRMANLIRKGVPADSILAVTFTNKAAEEMQTRVSDLLLQAGVPPERPWLSTFHSLCARLLRREAAAAGLPSNFSIFDDSDQLAAVKLAMSSLNLEDEELQPRAILSQISFAKNHAKTPETLRAEAYTPDMRHAAHVYAQHERMRAQRKAPRCDRLLLRAARHRRQSPQVREQWQRRFRHRHVDEYQHSNRVQYELLRLLVGPQQHICVVGDEDQSIYRWRGGDV